jgi:RNA polymerase sigma-70 factor (ECF subfamily)
LVLIAKPARDLFCLQKPVLRRNYADLPRFLALYGIVTALCGFRDTLTLRAEFGIVVMNFMLDGFKSFREKFLLFKVRSQKDKKAFGELYNLYRDRLYRFIFFKVSGAEDAGELTNDVFFKVWRFIQNGGEITSFAALLYSTARNAVNDHYRQKGAPTVAVDYLENLEDPQVATADIERVEVGLEKEFDENRLLEALKRIKDGYREILVMRYLDEMSFRDIAQALGKSEGNVRVLVFRATEALKNKIIPPS